jgi:hypothetical protein
MVFKYISIFATVFILSCTLNSRPDEPVASKGVLDLSGWDFDKHGSLDLFGEWEFYPEQFLSRSDFPRQEVQYIKVPSLWNDFEWKGKKLTGHNFVPID